MHATRVLVLLLMSGVCLCASRAVDTASDLLDELTPEVVKAWQEAGAEVIWVGKDSETGHLFETYLTTWDADCITLPCFRIRVWKPRLLQKLPQPAKPFALDLSHSNITDADLRELAALSRLTWLSFAHTRISDAGLKELVALPALEALDLSFTPITDQGLDYLLDTPRLHSLCLEGTQVTPQGLRLLEGMNLQALGIPQRCKTDTGLACYLSAVEPRMRLDLSQWQISDAGLKELAQYKKHRQLQWLSLADTSITDAGLAELLPLQELVGLDLSGTAITVAGLQHLTHLKNLRYLQLDRTLISLERPNKIADLLLKCLGPPELSKINLIVKHLPCIGQHSIRLILTNWHITDTGLQALSKLSNLEHLSLRSLHITDEGLQELAKIKQLRYLDLTDTSVTDVGLQHLKGMQLQTLALPSQCYTDLGLKHYIAALAQPRQLDLRD